jgi:Domain of unknown function DUF1828
MPTPCEYITQRVGELYSCAEINEYIRIRTPYLYPDGDYIDVFFKQEGHYGTLSDLGETLRWLRMQSIGQKRSPKQNQLIEDVRVTHGVEFYRGTLSTRVLRPENLAADVTRLAQACLRISDLYFTLRRRAVESVTDEVADLLEQRRVQFVRSERIPGRSGRVWNIDFHTRLPVRSSLVHVLSTGSRAAARAVSNHVLACWYDLSHLATGPEGLRFVSLFDDTMDVWTPEDFRLVEDLSEVAFWSRPDQFLEQLAA